MKLILQNTAHDSLEDIFDYLANYSFKDAIETTENIYELIYNLKIHPNMGKMISNIKNKKFRELIYKKSRNAYGIIYYISENTSTIQILYIANTKQNFNHIFKLHN